MDWLISSIAVLNSASPLAVIALLGLIIFLLVRRDIALTKKVDAIKHNDLHEMPEVAENLRQVVLTLQRIEVKLSAEFAYIRARLNGQG